MINIQKLKFESEIEEQYKAYIANRDQRYIRVAFLLFAGLYAIFGWSDYLLVPQWLSLFFVIRFYVVIPVLLLTIAFTFHPNYYQVKQPLLFFNFVIAGGGIAIMLIMEPLNILYYGGLFLVFTSGYFMLNLDFKYAVWGGFIVLGTFMIGVVVTNGMSLIVFNTSLFLIAENLIGSFGTYQIERFHRNEFLNLHNMSKEQFHLNYVVNEKTKEIITAQVSTITALAKLAESRDHDTGEHIERVGEICYKITEALPISRLEKSVNQKEFCDAMLHASVLHDIGKVAISDAILNKPGPLSAEECSIMSTHSQIGSATLAKLYEQYPNNLYVKLGIEITRSHHERWDGTGYPDGLKAYEIPLSARIMAIADAYDALISIRPYKPAFSCARAIEIIKEESGTHFDPELVITFLSIFDDLS